MKILFLCMANEFTPEMKYKENYLIQAAVENNDNVYVISNTKTYIDGKTAFVNPGEYGFDGYKLIRMNPKKFVFSILTDKLRVTPGLKEKILDIEPDVIFYNCPQVWNVNELKEIRKKLPKCVIIWDFSTWYGNSGSNWISLNILHKGIYRHWLKKNEKYVSKIYYTADDPHKFIREVYQLDEKKMRLNDLPSEILSDEELSKKRKFFREQESIDDETIVFVHTGKMGKQKKTVELLKCFNHLSQNYDTYLYIVGSLDDAIQEEALALIHANPKVRYVGFKKADEMMEIISGCDVYLQPGSTSQTFQEAVCRGCIPIYAERSYDKKLVGEYGIELHTDTELEDGMLMLLNNPEGIREMRKGLLKRVGEQLDYRKLYQKMIDPNEMR